MKLKNPKVWATIPVAQITQVTMLRIYQEGLGKIRQRVGGHQHDWNEEKSLPEWVRHVQHDLKGYQVAPYTACIVGYQIPDPSRNIHRGLDRRHALSLLRRLGLEAPSAMQVVQLASQIISNSERINDVLGINPHQNIVCPTPINPESPDYYYFGKGHEGKGSFRAMNYDRVEREDNLYFWHHDEKNHPQLELWGYHFPFVLGVQPNKS